uniref:Uncharacterized protein n=1 Tax=Dipterosiphonia australica TaxID=2007208 RepID=A0A1Z1ML42_9FLOR|nr:hypothetical protein [Dipterosiphonia australica]ARW66778.1 hypothetical protein [Dipterosiphonia australica]
MNRVTPICIISLKNNIFISNQISKSITNPLKLIAINEGSHTRLIEYITSNQVKIKVVQQHRIEYRETYRKIRYVWLKTSAYTIMTLAKSLWKIKQKNSPINSIKINNPIGQSFIDLQVDLNKNFGELHYSYCKDFERKLRSKRPIWGRKYRLSNNNDLNIIIQEFFSPDIFF